MKDIIEIYRHTFKYRSLALLVILSNILYVVFNLISLALFVPFLQVIFNEEQAIEVFSEPIYSGGFLDFFKYAGEYYQYFMQTSSQSDPKGALFFVCVTVAISFFLKNFSRYLAIWFQSQLRMAVVRDVRDQLFEKALKLPLSHYTDENRGDLMARMQNDVLEIENAVISMLELFFREPIAITITLSLLFYWSTELTLFALLLLPITALIIAVIGKSLKRTARQEKSQMGVLFSAMDEGLGGIRIIKAFNAIPQVLQSFQKENLKHQKLVTKAFRKRDLSSPLNEIIGSLVMISIVWYGGLLALDSESTGFSGETFIGFIIVFSKLMRPISSVLNAFQT